ncbi:hypothetical protein M0R45_030842 [Rubus argutus]|uniref:Uncharacterized protein n=1 Tax=Rubus argutus TaxID=59490 RepID=A0AAW1WEU4_RUBAR
MTPVNGSMPSHIEEREFVDCEGERGRRLGIGKWAVPVLVLEWCRQRGEQISGKGARIEHGWAVMMNGDGGGEGRCFAQGLRRPGFGCRFGFVEAIGYGLGWKGW